MTGPGPLGLLSNQNLARFPSSSGLQPGLHLPLTLGGLQRPKGAVAHTSRRRHLTLVLLEVRTITWLSPSTHLPLPASVQNCYRCSVENLEKAERRHAGITTVNISCVLFSVIFLCIWT